MKWSIMTDEVGYLVSVVADCHVEYHKSCGWEIVGPPMQYLTAKKQADMIVDFT